MMDGILTNYRFARGGILTGLRSQEGVNGTDYGGGYRVDAGLLSKLVVTVIMINTSGWAVGLAEVIV